VNFRERRKARRPLLIWITPGTNGLSKHATLPWIPTDPEDIAFQEKQLRIWGGQIPSRGDSRPWLAHGLGQGLGDRLHPLPHRLYPLRLPVHRRRPLLTISASLRLRTALGIPASLRIPALLRWLLRIPASCGPQCGAAARSAPGRGRRLARSAPGEVGVAARSASQRGRRRGETAAAARSQEQRVGRSSRISGAARGPKQRDLRSSEIGSAARSASQ
jgi:hypothetical protein